MEYPLCFIPPPPDFMCGAQRSPQWERKEREFKAGKVCAACGTDRELEVHHLEPFHLHPELELEDGNLIVLCRIDHFVFGHFHNWKLWNPNCRKDVELYFAILTEIKSRAA